MEDSSGNDRAWSTISPTAAPPQLLYLDTLRASDFGQFYNRHRVRETIYTPAKHQWLMEELMPEWQPE